MKGILEELKGSVSGVIGSFVIDVNGRVPIQDMPDSLSEQTNKVSNTLHHVMNVIKSTKPADKISIDSNGGKVFVVVLGDNILVVVTEKTINKPLFNLMFNMAVSKLKEVTIEPVIPEEKVVPEKPSPVQEEKTVPEKSEPVKAAPEKPEPVQKTPTEKPAPTKSKPAKKESKPVAGDDIDEIFNVYDKLFDAVAKKITIMFGPGAAQIFEKNLDSVKSNYGELLEDVNFGNDGKPNMTKLKLNAQKQKRDKAVQGLEAILESMVEAVKNTSGAKVADRAKAEIHVIKDENKGII